MERQFYILLPLTDACGEWCTKNDLDVGPTFPVEAASLPEIVKSLTDAGFREGFDFEVR